MTDRGRPSGGLVQPCCQGGHRSGDGAGMVAASGQMGSVARHQTAQSDIPSSQGLHYLEPFEESLTGRRGLKIPRASKSIAGRDVAALDRFGGLACQTMEAGPKCGASRAGSAGQP